jgi:hypothetical protein
MKIVFEKYDTTRTEELLRKNGFKFDKHGGVISFIGGDSAKNITTTLNVSYRSILTIIGYEDNKILFDFNTSKTSLFPNKKHLKIMTAEEWFEFMEKVATSLALELGLGEISVYTGLIDKPYVLSKGYEKCRKNYFSKKIDTSVLLNIG